ncbi:MAG: sigma-70 RNA polymerase sigma factor region 4 domain-containing protein [Ktedonobacteraceae bacterium]
MIALRSLQPQPQLPSQSKPEHLTVSELLPEAFQEIQAYLRQQPKANTGACAFELFRRAIGQRDEQAWAGIYELYHTMVGSWMLRRWPSISKEELESLVNEVFTKFFRSLGPEKLRNFLSVGAFLAYLKCCASSVLADYCRLQQTQRREESLEFMTQELTQDDFASSVVDHLVAQEMWGILSRAVLARDERLVLVMVCIMEWSPAELQRHEPRLFPSVEDVYRVKRNVLERLRRNKDLLHLVERQTSYHPRREREVRYAS